MRLDTFYNIPHSQDHMEFFLQCFGQRARVMATYQTPPDDTLFVAEKDRMELRLSLDGIIRTNGWKQNFAQAVFEALQKAIEAARPMSDALREIHARLSNIIDGVKGSVEIHPILCALTALGILVLLYPWVIEALDFIEGRILECQKYPSST